MKKFTKLFVTCLMLISLIACDWFEDAHPQQNLTIFIMRHGEKPKDGDNLSCQGLNRALALPNILANQIGTPDFIYVPELKMAESTRHARMFQTITPFAIKYNLNINSQFKTDEFSKIRKNIFEKNGKVLLVWSHSEIKKLTKALGVKKVPDWEDDDFNSLWMIDYKNGKAQFSIKNLGLQPVENCPF